MLGFKRTASLVLLLAACEPHVDPRETLSGCVTGTNGVIVEASYCTFRSIRSSCDTRVTKDPDDMSSIPTRRLITPLPSKHIRCTYDVVLDDGRQFHLVRLFDHATPENVQCETSPMRVVYAPKEPELVVECAPTLSTK